MDLPTTQAKPLVFNEVNILSAFASGVKRFAFFRFFSAKLACACGSNF
jgi:hypothetical protein